MIFHFSVNVAKTYLDELKLSRNFEIKLSISFSSIFLIQVLKILIFGNLNNSKTRSLSERNSTELEQLLWYGQTRITSYELRVKSLKARVDRLKARVKIPKSLFRFKSYEFKSTNYEFKSTSYEFKSTSYEFKSTSYELKLTSYEFKCSSPRIIKSMKTQVNSLQIFTRN